MIICDLLWSELIKCDLVCSEIIAYVTRLITNILMSLIEITCVLGWTIEITKWFSSFYEIRDDFQWSDVIRCDYYRFWCSNVIICDFMRFELIKCDLLWPEIIAQVPKLLKIFCSVFMWSSVFWVDQKRSQNDLAHFMWSEMIFSDLMWFLVIIRHFRGLMWLFVIWCDLN